MLDQYKIITATHKTAPFKALGGYVLSDDQNIVASKLEELKANFNLDEIFYLATCNRIIFLIVSDLDQGEQFKNSFLAQIYDHQDESSSTHFQILSGDEAVLHLHRVAGSMDSMVVGEREILRQMREAYEWCKSQKLTGDLTRILFDSIVASAKHIYSNTRIGEKPISIVSLAMQQLSKTGINSDARILVIGAGKTNNLVSKFLLKQGLTNVTVFNRSIEGAQKIARKFNSEAQPLLELASYKNGFDAIIICTGSIEPIITTSVYQALLQGDLSKKVVVDLAVPNNVSTAVVKTFDLDYISVESLKVISQENLNFRHREVELAETMLIEALANFKKLFRERQLETAFQEIPREIKAIKRHAIDTVFKTEIDQLDSDSKAVIEKVLSYMEKKCIGIPMKVVRELAD